MGVVVGRWLEQEVCQWLLCLLNKAARAIMFQFLSMVMFLLVSPMLSMDFGGSGVWDSPMATDHYVRQFGWLFGGGRSGLAGMKAMTSNRVETGGMKYSSPYKYEYDDRNRFNLFAVPSVTVSSASRTNLRSRSFLRAKPMVKLSPMVLGGVSKSQAVFQPFMAVP